MFCGLSLMDEDSMVFPVVSVNLIKLFKLKIEHCKFLSVYFTEICQYAILLIKIFYQFFGFSQ